MRMGWMSPKSRSFRTMSIPALPWPRASAALAAQESSPASEVSTVEAMTLRSPLYTRTAAPATTASFTSSTLSAIMLIR